MTDFEYFFAFFGLLLSLTVAEVAIKFADSIDSHHRRPIGLLSPLLAMYVLLDITNFWIFTWAARHLITVNWLTLLGALAIALSYFLSAALVFPRCPEDWATLDEHFWARRRYVLTGIVLANVLLRVFELTRALPSLSDFWFYFINAWLVIVYAGLWFSKTRPQMFLFLGLAILFHMLIFIGITPTSHWAHKIGLNVADTAPAASHEGSEALR